MSYPSTIPNSFEGYDLTSCNRGDNSFNYGDARYLFMRQGGFATIASAPSPQFASGTLRMHCFKSADDGQTWTDMGSVNTQAADAVGGGFGGVGPIMRDGSLVYFVGMVMSGGNVASLKVFTYDLSTDSWDSGTPYSAPVPFRDTRPPHVLAKLVLLSAGSYLLVYNGTVETISGVDYRRIYISTYDGSTWGTETAVPDESGNTTDYYFTDAIVDAGGVMHVLYTLKVNGGIAAVCHRSLNGSTWSSEQQIATAFPSALPLPDSWSNFALDVATNRILFAGQHDNSSANGSLTLYYGDIADSPTWGAAPIADITQDATPLGAFTGVIGKAFGIGVYGSTICIVEALTVGSNPPGGQIYYRTAATSDLFTWSGDTLLLDTPAVTQSGATNPADAYGAHAVAAYVDTDGIAVVAEWECRFTPDSGAEVAQFTILIPSPPTATIGNVWGCGSAPEPGNHW